VVTAALAVLVPLVPAIERLQTAQVEQRRVVVAGDLTAMLAINATIEETSARISLLEQRRQVIQTELEEELTIEKLYGDIQTRVTHGAP